MGQHGFQWTRLAELVWMPRVSARDLDSEVEISKISSKTLVVCPILGWKDFYCNHKSYIYIYIYNFFVDFRNQGSRHIAVQKAPGQVPAGAPRRVSIFCYNRNPSIPELDKRPRFWNSFCRIWSQDQDLGLKLAASILTRQGASIGIHFDPHFVPDLTQHVFRSL